MSKQSAKLVCEFTFRSAVSAPQEVGIGPFGHRQYYAMRDGVIEGPRLTGKLVGAGSDWMLMGADGFMRMDVRIQIGTEDGAVICVRYFGPAEANEVLGQAAAACSPTEFSVQSIRTHWLLESGDPRYAWVNQNVFVGEGRLCPAEPGVLGFEHRVYRVGSVSHQERDARSRKTAPERRTS